MKHIRKTTEPSSLTEYRSTPNANFDGCNKKDIRRSLITEQGAICAYCMQRISDKRNVKLAKSCTEIEHYKSQDVFNGENRNPDLRLNYNNMLGVCNGNAGQPKNKLHCDKSKDLQENKPFLPLLIDPLDANCERLVEYKGNGRVSSDNARINNELDKILNLNEVNLVKNRAVAIEKAINSIQNAQRGRKGEGWKIASIKAELGKWKELYKSTRKQNDDGVDAFYPDSYRVYCGAVIYYLEKKLRRYE